MRRTIQAIADHFSVVDDTGGIVVAAGPGFQVLNVEGTPRIGHEFDRVIHFTLGSPYVTLGLEGSIYILSPKGELIGYLFPAGSESAIPTCAAYSSTTTQIAVGVGNSVLIYDLNKKLESALVALLDGHEAPIIQCAFLTYAGYEHLVITCSEDSRFIVWDLTKRCICYESPFESAHRISGIATFDSNHLFALAFEDGFVKLYDASPILDKKPSVRFVRAINLTRAELELDDDEEEEPSIVISKKKPPKPAPKPDISARPSPAIIAAGSASLHGREYMVCATPSSVVALNIATFERMVVHVFEFPAKSVAFNELIVASSAAEAPGIFIKRMAMGVVPDIGLELFPEGDPPDDSPLMISIDLKTKQAAPIATLHKIVKSSGYSKKPEPSRAVKKPPGKKTVKTPRVESQVIVASFKVPRAVTATFQPHEASIATAAMSADGKRTICADNAGTIVLVKQKATPAYVGHSQPVTALSWSNSTGFMSASLDRTVKFWDTARPDPLLTMSKTKSETRGTLFPDDVTGASYFWSDKFVLLGFAQSVSLYGYHLPFLNANAKTVADMHQTGTYKCVRSVLVDTGKIIAMAASNLPTSPIALVATSARFIHAIDFYNGQKILDIDTKHERAIHSIVANFGGIYTPRSADTPDLALTGALDETFKIWDLRSARSERVIPIGSRTMRVGMCFSPDSRFVALGTERLGVEIWDVGQGKCVSKLKDDLRGVTVTWVDWNPSSGKIHCGLENGIVKVFG
jgi:WD40 repeat protein